jgi:hypothetical protein
MEEQKKKLEQAKKVAIPPPNLELQAAGRKYLEEQRKIQAAKTEAAKKALKEDQRMIQTVKEQAAKKVLDTKVSNEHISIARPSGPNVEKKLSRPVMSTAVTATPQQCQKEKDQNVNEKKWWEHLARQQSSKRNQKRI